MSGAAIILLLVYLLTILLAATEIVPLSMSALIGALLTVWFGIQYAGLTPQQLINLNDMFPILGLIVGTMIVVEVARKSDVFHFGALYAIKLSGGSPAKLFVAICVISAAASLFLSDSTAMLLMAAAIVAIAKLLRYDPLPYFLSAVIMINLGGTSTLIGSVSNMAIGVQAKMSFNEFLIYLTPCELALWALMIIVLYKIFKPRLGQKRELPTYNPWEVVKDKRRFRRSSFVLFLLIILFLVMERLEIGPGVTIGPEIIALGCAVFALTISGFDPAEIFREIDWETVFFVAGFLVIVNGLQASDVLVEASNFILNIAGENELLLTMMTLWFSGLASTVVSNIAIALTFAPLIKNMEASRAVWSALVLGTNLGGATTPFSSAACVMAAGALKREGISLSFAEFTKIGAITSLIQLAFSSIYLILRFGLVM
ncbi:MAG: hypothetical protein J7J44_05725 [Deltaproteobacteria bacterium]|nr:hypothetical protein [Deltaproteobacteria bacterium]